MHLIATYFPVLIDWALSTSENVPSPFLLINRYSIQIRIVRLVFEYNKMVVVVFMALTTYCAYFQEYI